jgi:L-asparagine oxygenase
VALGSEGPIHQLRPRRVEEAPLNTYSGNYGLGEFPLHTDLAHWFLPPRYFLLRCVVGFGNIPTVLVDGFPLVKQVGTTALTHALMQPRRPVNGKRSLLRLFQIAGSAASLIRWDEKYIQPATKAGASGASRFSKVLAVAPRILASLSQPGDTIVIDNWRMLHGRAAVPKSCLSRIIDRVYLRSKLASMNSIIPVVSSSTWDSGAMLAKAQRYAEEMQRHAHDDWRFAFWSSLTLELIARSALAKVSPVLLADHTNWNNLYYALGNIPNASKFSPKSITIAEVQ